VSIEISVEPAHHAGPRALIYAAEDELDRRYGHVQSDPTVPLDELSEPNGRFLVARDNGELVGGVGVRRVGDPGVRAGEVKRLWTRPDRRRSGVAETLMAACEEAALALGLATLYLECGDRQPEAQSFYRKLGWRAIEEFPSGVWSHRGSTKFARDLAPR
jgi:GNAT superfamily N-acetyltransferase